MESQQLVELQKIEDRQADNDILKNIFGEKEADVKLLQQQRESPSVSQWEQSFYDVIDEMEHIIKGEMRGSNGEWTLIGPGFRIANDLFIHDLKLLLNAVVNRNTFQTVFDKERIYYFVRKFRINFISMLNKHNYYDLDRRYRDYLLDGFTEIVAAALFRSLDGGEAKRRASTTINRYTYGSIERPMHDKEKKGMLGIGILGL